jgi:hypothetical protein
MEKDFNPFFRLGNDYRPFGEFASRDILSRFQKKIAHSGYF